MIILSYSNCRLVVFFAFKPYSLMVISALFQFGFPIFTGLSSNVLGSILNQSEKQKLRFLTRANQKKA